MVNKRQEKIINHKGRKNTMSGRIKLHMTPERNNKRETLKLKHEMSSNGKVLKLIHPIDQYENID